MNREVEERIVAMYFDNKDFEKNAQTTIDTLGQLKESLVIDDKSAEKSFSVFEKIGKVLDFSKANQGLTRMKSTMSSMGNFFKNAFKLDGLDEAERKLNSFKRNYLDRVIGFDIADKLVHSVENAFRQLTIAPVSAGWDQYQSKMDSVKTIMSSTGEDLNTVEKYLSEMTDYANKTIYSLTDMTSNLGKFTNNGIDLERSVQAMEGIANATADAGQGAQQASMAMYNISQAMGVGKMTTIDWKSLENANIATQKLKNTFLEMAAASGRLKKEVKDIAGKQVTQYFLETDDEGKKLKERIELTAANFREYLSKGWLDKEVMLRTFQLYSGQGIDVDLLESWGITDKNQQKELIEMGQQALESATQVRTFSKMMDALSESVQSSWAETFELIFGNMEQGTQLWTKLSEEIDGILSKSAEVRNNILKIWSGEYISTESEKKQLAEKQETLEGLEAYLAQLEEANDSTKLGQRINEIQAQIQKYKDEITAFNNEKDQNGKKVNNTEKIKQRQQRIKELEATMKELKQKQKELDKQEQSRSKATEYDKEIQKYKDEIKELEKTDIKDKNGEDDPDKIKQRDRLIAEKQKKLIEIQKKRDQLTGTSNQEIEKTKKEIAALKEDIDTLNGMINDKESKAKSEYVDEEGRSGRDIAIDSLYEMIDLVKKLGAAISEAFHNVFGSMDAGKLFDMTVKVEEAVKRLVAWFGEASDSSSRLSKIQKGLQGVFSVLKAGWKVISSVFNLLKRLAAPVLDVLVEAFGKVGGFFDGFGDLNIGKMFAKMGDGVKGLWEKIKGIFSAKAGEKSPFAAWAETAWKDFKSILRSWANEVGLGGALDEISKVWNTLTGWEGWSQIGAFFQTIWDSVTGWFREGTDENGNTTRSGFAQFLWNCWDWLTKTWNGIKKVCGPVVEEIGMFLSNTWDWIVAQFTPTEQEDGTTRSPIEKFLSDSWDAIVTAWEEVKKVCGPVVEEVGQFLSDTWGWIVAQFKPKQRYDERGIALNDTRSPIEKFLSDSWDAIVTAWEEVKKVCGPVVEEVGQFLSDTWNWIVAQFTPTEQEDGTTRSPIEKFLSDSWDAIVTAWEEVKKVCGPIVQEVGQFLSDTWGWIVAQFKPKQRYDERGIALYDTRSPIEEFLTNAWEKIKNAWKEIKKWPGWSAIGEFFTNTWNWIIGKGNEDTTGDEPTVGEAIQEVVDSVTPENGKETAKQAEDSVSLLERIFKPVGEFFEKVGEAFSKITGFQELNEFLAGVSSFFTGLLHLVGEVAGKLGNVMRGEGSFKDLTVVIVPGLIMLVNQIFTLMNNRALAGISSGQTFAMKFLEIAGGLFLMATAVGILTAIDQDKMRQAVGAIVALGAVLTAIIGIIGNLTGGGVASAVTTTKGERILNGLISTLGKLGTIFIVMKMLPDVIRAFGEAKQLAGGAEFGQDALNTMLGITAMISGVSIVFAVIQKITAGVGLSPMATVKSVLAIMAAIGIVLAAFTATGWIRSLIGHEGAQKLTEYIETTGEMLETLGKAMGGFIRGLFGIKSDSEKAGEAIEIFSMMSNASSVFTSEKVSGVSRMMTLLSNLSENGMEFNTTKLSNFAVAMGQMGSGIYEIATYLQEVEGPLAELHNPDSIMFQKLEGFATFYKKLAEAITPFGQEGFSMKNALSRFSYLASDDGGSNLEKFVEDTNKVIEALGDIDDPNSGIQFDGVLILQRLYEAIQTGIDDPSLPAFDATGIVDDILLALQLGDSAIRQVVHEMVQHGIELSGKDVNENGYETGDTQWLEKLLNNGGNLDGLVDSTALTEQLFGKDNEGGIMGIMNSFEDQVPSVSSIFKEKGWMDFTDENGEQIDILSEIQGQLNDLGTTLSNIDPLKITITPVFDYQNLTPEAIQAHMGSMPIKFLAGPSTNSLRIEFTGLSTELGMDAIRQKLDEIASRISVWGANEVLSTNNLGGHMSDIATNISRLKVVLDTNKMVGEMVPLIDFELMRRSNVYGRTGVK